MVHSRRSWFGFAIAILAVSSIVAQPPLLAANGDEAGAAEADSKQLRELWRDFCHYVRIARSDLAQASARALLDQVDDEQLLDVVEGGDYQDWEQILIRAERVDVTGAVAEEMTRRIQAGRIARARDPKRIGQDIELLAQGPRANHNAIQRLRAAEEHAVPALLATLLDDTQKRLHTYVLNAMVAMGRPAVYPLAVAMVKLEDVPQGQVAQVLAEIGYPRAAPYLKEIVEREQTDPDTRAIAAAAFEHLANSAGVPSGVSASEMYLALGQNHYRAKTDRMMLPGYDPGDTEGLVWSYTAEAGLVATAVPARIFGDVLAMDAARQALLLDPQRGQALSLWLMANLRRENDLGPDDRDLSYSSEWLEAMFYLVAAGPLRQHDVLEQALSDGDSVLALDGIEALQATAGTDSLINRGGTVQPLLRALAYPDRRVRFEAAFALTNARPTEVFPGSHGVVPVLAEALRQTDIRYAVVLGADQDSTNRITAMLHELGYEPIGGTSMTQLGEAIRGKPGIDLVVTNQSPDQVEQFSHDRVGDYKLSAVPMIILSSPFNMPEFNRLFDRRRDVFTVASTDKALELKPALEQAVQAHAGESIGEEEAHDYATTALMLLRQVTLGSSEVFNVYDALPALIQAIADVRPDIVAQAADVVSLIDTTEGQQAIADATLDVTRSTELRILLLGSLAESTKHIGNRLNEPQLDRLLELVKTSDGPMALAAARAHGALTLPTGNVVKMLTE